MADNETHDLGRWLASELLRIGAVSLRPERPFTWASGLRSPIYCDNRLTLSYPALRRRITEGLGALIHAHGLKPDVVVGTATAGIPQAALLADRLDLPMAYVRASAKAHGQGKRVEGVVEQGRRVVVVEDLVSTGSSSVSVVDALRHETGAEVAAVLAIFTYGLPQAEETFQQARVPLYALTTYRTLTEVARHQLSLGERAMEALGEWQRDPAAWSEAHAAQVE